MVATAAGAAECDGMAWDGMGVTKSKKGQMVRVMKRLHRKEENTRNFAFGFGPRFSSILLLPELARGVQDFNREGEGRERKGGKSSSMLPTSSIACLITRDQV